VGHWFAIVRFVADFRERIRAGRSTNAREITDAVNQVVRMAPDDHFGLTDWQLEVLIAWAFFGPEDERNLVRRGPAAPPDDVTASSARARGLANASLPSWQVLVLYGARLPRDDAQPWTRRWPLAFLQVECFVNCATASGAASLRKLLVLDLPPDEVAEALMEVWHALIVSGCQCDKERCRAEHRLEGWDLSARRATLATIARQAVLGSARPDFYSGFFSRGLLFQHLHDSPKYALEEGQTPLWACHVCAAAPLSHVCATAKLSRLDSKCERCGKGFDEKQDHCENKSTLLAPFYFQEELWARCGAGRGVGETPCRNIYPQWKPACPLVACGKTRPNERRLRVWRQIADPMAGPEADGPLLGPTPSRRGGGPTVDEWSAEDDGDDDAEADEEDNR